MLRFDRKQQNSVSNYPLIKDKIIIIIKSSNINLSTKVHLVKAMVFPVVIYGCESWTLKKAEHRRTEDFELWCWRRFLSIPGLQGDPASQS